MNNYEDCLLEITKLYGLSQMEYDRQRPTIVDYTHERMDGMAEFERKRILDLLQNR